MESDVIVVDDGSTDNPEEAFEQANLLGSIRFVRQENQGVAVHMLRTRMYRIGYCNYRYFANVPDYPDVNIRYPTFEGQVLGRIISENFILTTGIVVMERTVLDDLLFDAKRLGTDDWAMWLQVLMRHPICVHRNGS